MDSKLEFYKALGGGKLNSYSKCGFLCTFLCCCCSQLNKNIRKGRGYKQKKNLVGEGLITGGLYVVRTSGDPEYSFQEKVIGDHADLKELMDACKKVSSV